PEKKKKNMGSIKAVETIKLEVDVNVGTPNSKDERIPGFCITVYLKFKRFDSGVHQGWVLAPTLVVGSSGCGASVGEERFTDLDFTDDAVILAESIEALIGALERLSKESECLGFRVSWIKTKIQAFNDFLGTAISSVSVCGENVDLVERFTYISSDIHVSGDSSFWCTYKHALHLRQKNDIMKSTDTTLSTKVCMVKSIVFPVVMYGCENWTGSKAECKRTDTVEL
uniref:Reverse transcriptase domain-containing protein n=1 Tax=Paramormyrops kingsleyae TaxID=1676925 RepID=A0A3B3R3I5_9TELE